MEIIIGISRVTINLYPDPLTQTYVVDATFELANGETQHTELTTSSLTFSIAFTTYTPWWRPRKKSEPLMVKGMALSIAKTAGVGYKVFLSYQYSDGTAENGTHHINRFPLSVRFYGNPLHVAN